MWECLRRCSRLTIDVMTDWLSEEVNRGRFGSVPVAIVVGSLRGAIVAGSLRGAIVAGSLFDM